MSVSYFNFTISRFPTEEDLGSVYRRYFIFFSTNLASATKKKETNFKSFFSILQPHPLGQAVNKPSAVSISVHMLLKRKKICEQTKRFVPCGFEKFYTCSGEHKYICFLFIRISSEKSRWDRQTQWDTKKRTRTKLPIGEFRKRK